LEGWEKATYWILDEQILQRAENSSIAENIVTQDRGESLTYLQPHHRNRTGNDLLVKEMD
jgi:hypothetical protein